MQTLETLLAFVLEHKELFVTLAVTLVTLIKLTSWGQAKAEALDAVIGVVEGLGAKEVKAGVAGKETALDPAAQDALRHAVAKADPKKTVEDFLVRVLREVFRGMLPQK